jgi:hypothetical protein
MHIQNNGISPATPRIYIWHTITNKPYSPKLLIIFCSVQNLFPTDNFRFMYKENNIIPALTVRPLSHLTSYTTSNVFLVNSLATVVSESGL